MRAGGLAASPLPRRLLPDSERDKGGDSFELNKKGKEDCDLENEAREVHLQFNSKQKKAEMMLQKAKRDQELRAENRYCCHKQI
jgi:hypothetical protein